ncbi:MAG: FAD binding domain-containing protein [Spirochaetota bacterium]
MRAFDFIRVKETEKVLSLLKEYKGKARVIAGGTDVMIGLRKETLPESVEMLLDISGLKELNYIKEDGNYIRIGACTTHAQCAESQLLKKHASLLAEAASAVGSPQIRNRGTIGGNIVTAAPCADTVPAFIALNAVCRLRRGKQSREIPLAEMITGPHRVNIAPDELLTEIYFEKLKAGTHSLFIKLVRRNALDKARMSFSVIASLNDKGEVHDIRISVGATTPVPCRFQAAENVLLGNVPIEKLIREAAGKVSKTMIEKSGYRWSTDYKQKVVASLTVRALKTVLGV